MVWGKSVERIQAPLLMPLKAGGWIMLELHGWSYMLELHGWSYMGGVMKEFTMCV